MKAEVPRPKTQPRIWKLCLRQMNDWLSLKHGSDHLHQTLFCSSRWHTFIQTLAHKLL